MLLRKVADAGFIPSLTLPPRHAVHRPDDLGCLHPSGGLDRANRGRDRGADERGGGFPVASRGAEVPQLEAIFALIDRVTTECSAKNRPLLICEPGRGLVADAFTVATQVKAVRDGAHVFLNDGVYGSLPNCR